MTQQDESRVAVVTGASSGIGKAAAEALAAQGWHVIAHGRDPGRTAAAEADIRAVAAPGAKVDMIRGDLALLSDAARLAKEIERLTEKVHVMLNNAGGVRSELVITPEGNEATFAGNHLSHFLLTHRLLPRLRAAAANSQPGTVRVLSVTSNGHEGCPGLKWDDLQQTREWASGKSYCLAKLCNILFTRELAKREAVYGIVANSMHPGVVASNFANHAEPRMKSYMATLESFSPEVGADTLVWLATAPEAGGLTGGYFHKRQSLTPSPAALDDEAAARLWTESEALVTRAGV
ncbi:MAG: short chain dehydrogenase family protein [Gammaproteobacteria bacterium]|jgi:NAD(P)-dependent dehydrogenase (short-subunit alcohol dehydrogenase family)|nr:short chain dehydrogenase family protein [Gammaproteobacteria bacterium]